MASVMQSTNIKGMAPEKFAKAIENTKEKQDIVNQLKKIQIDKIAIIPDSFSKKYFKDASTDELHRFKDWLDSSIKDKKINIYPIKEPSEPEKIMIDAMDKKLKKYITIELEQPDKQKKEKSKREMTQNEADIQRGKAEEAERKKAEEQETLKRLQEESNKRKSDVDRSRIASLAEAERRAKTEKVKETKERQKQEKADKASRAMIKMEEPKSAAPSQTGMQSEPVKRKKQIKPTKNPSRQQTATPTKKSKQITEPASESDIEEAEKQNGNMYAGLKVEEEKPDLPPKRRGRKPKVEAPNGSALKKMEGTLDPNQLKTVEVETASNSAYSAGTPNKSFDTNKSAVKKGVQQPVGLPITQLLNSKKDEGENIPVQPAKNFKNDPASQSIYRRQNPEPIYDNPSLNGQKPANVSFASPQYNTLTYNTGLGVQKLVPDHIIEGRTRNDLGQFTTSRREAIGDPASNIGFNPNNPSTYKSNVEEESATNQPVRLLSGQYIGRPQSSIYPNSSMSSVYPQIGSSSLEYENERGEYEEYKNLDEMKYVERGPEPVYRYKLPAGYKPRQTYESKIEPQYKNPYSNPYGRYARYRAQPEAQPEPYTEPKYHPYSREELMARDAERNASRRQLMDEAVEAKEQDRTIGFRENTGLDTRVSSARADLTVKPQEEIQKSIKAFADFSWIPKGARNDSKLGQYSTLQQMQDMHDEMRFGDTYNPEIAFDRLKPIHEIFSENKELFRGMTNNRFIPQNAILEQVRVPQNNQNNVKFGPRPVMARPPTIDDMGDYSYDDGCNHVGTQNLGLVRQYSDYVRPDYENDNTHYNSIIYGIDGREYIV